MNQWLLSMLINLLFTLLVNGAPTIDWAAFLAKADDFVNQFIPKFFWPAIDGLIAGGVAALQLALSDVNDLAAIKADLQAGDWNKALADLRALLANITHPHALALSDAAGLHRLTAAGAAMVLNVPPAGPAATDGDEGKGGAVA